MLGRFGTRLHQMSGPVALLLVLTGGIAYAADTVGSVDIIDNQVASVDLRNNEVRSVDVRDDSLASGGLGASDLGPGSVAASELAADAIPSDGGVPGEGSTKIESDAIGVNEIGLAAVAGSEIRNNAVTGTDVNEETLFNDNSLTGLDIDESTLPGMPLRGAETIDASPMGQPLNETAQLIDNGDGMGVKGVCFVDQPLPSIPPATYLAVRLVGQSDTVYASNSAHLGDESRDQNGTFTGWVTLPGHFDNVATRFEMMAPFGAAVTGQTIGRVNDDGSCTFFASGMG